jgi:small multidrug resistance pump
MKWVYLILSILTEVVAVLALKASDGFTRLWPLLLMAAAYGVSFFTFALAIRTISPGIAYAISAGLGLVFVSLFSWVLNHLRLDAPAVLGMFLIFSGIAVINLFSKSVNE